jgi:hypothetical protein
MGFLLILAVVDGGYMATIARKTRSAMPLKEEYQEGYERE